METANGIPAVAVNRRRVACPRQDERCTAAAAAAAAVSESAATLIF